MNKKILPFILAIPSFILLIIFKIIPALNTLLVSTRKFSPGRSILESPKVGMQNYTAIIQGFSFPNILMNTFLLSSLSILFTCIAAFVLILCISAMPNRLLKTAAIIIISIPAFVPIASYAGVFVRMLSAEYGFINSILKGIGMEPVLFLANKSLFWLIFTVMDTLRNVFIPVIIGVLACEKEGARLGKAGLAILIYALVRATLFLSPDLETLLLISNPLVNQSSEVFDSMVYKTGMMMMQFSQSAALWVIKTIVQLLMNIGIFFLISLLVPGLKGMADTLSSRRSRGDNTIISIFGYVLFALGSIGIIAAVFFPLTKRLTGVESTFEGIRFVLSNGMITKPFMNTLIYCIIGSILYGFVTLTLAFPMTVRTKIYPLLMVVVMTITNNLMGEYLFYKSLGMFNTVFPVILSSITVIGAFALHFSVSGKLGDEPPGLTDYLKASLCPLLGIVVLFFIGNWGGYLYQMIYLTNQQLYGVGMFGRTILHQTTGISQPVAAGTSIEAVRAAVILLSSIVPVVLGIILISLNKFIPLSAFSAQIRKG